MFRRLAVVLARPVTKPVLAFGGRVPTSVRFFAAQATGAGSQGRVMPQQTDRATAPVSPGTPATLTIKNGPVFRGKAFGANTSISGECVFTTSLTSYVETLSDPSFFGQILVFTQPMLGNYGVPSMERDEYNLLKHFESPHLHAAGIVVGDYAFKYSHWNAVESLATWAAREGVPCISGVDTRAIVTFLREQGSSLARLSVGDEYDADQDEAFIDPNQAHLVKQVSTKAPFFVASHSDADLHVALIDCGAKENIIRSIVKRGAHCTVLPHDFPIHKHAASFDGVFVSNGPGDPIQCQSTIYNLACLMETSPVPIMGICLGHQLIALAVGAKTIKLKHGHRAHNSPIFELSTGKAMINPQNHGYAVDASTLPDDWKELYVNLNDGTNEGIMHKTRPIVTAQGHPEAKGGPDDGAYLFDNYIENIRKYKASQTVYRDTRPSQLMLDLMGKERVGVGRKLTAGFA
jgi:carbamoyl-phosphate synthase small subunit